MNNKQSNVLRKPQAIDLFAGSGAVSRGLRDAGFNVVGALDFDPKACATYEMNHEGVKLIRRDIRKVPAKTFAQFKGEIDLLIVCAPCQPFSNRNRNRITKDERVDLVLRSLKFIRALKPSFVLFENVPGLEKNKVFEKLCKELVRAGYHLKEPQKVDAADLGVPQRRVRMVLCAALKAEWLDGVFNGQVSQRVSVREAIGDLLEPSFKSDNLEDPLHYKRRHSDLNLERLRHVPKNGGSRISLPDHLVLACHKELSENQYPDCYGRMSWDQEAPTLTTGCTDFTRGRYVHPEQDRAITLREAARLQSFPDDYKFNGNASEIATQIGNAVPPRMMQVIAERIKAVLENAKIRH